MPVGMVGRAFAILGCFDDRHVVLTLSELARRAGLPVNSTLRIARSLADEGALERREDGRFAIGLRLYELAALAPRGVGLRQASLPYLHDLHDLTGQHAMLSVREGDEAVLVERVSPKRATRSVGYRVGGRMPLTATGGGLALLAFAPDDVQETAIATFGARDAIDEVTTSAELRRYLSAVRRTGAAVGSQRSPRALVAAGVPIWDTGATVVAALSVVMPLGGADPRVIVPALQACARAITRDAGR